MDLSGVRRTPDVSIWVTDLVVPSVATAAILFRRSRIPGMSFSVYWELCNNRPAASKWRSRRQCRYSTERQMTRVVAFAFGALP
jgi:hypothetical protein